MRIINVTDESRIGLNNTWLDNTVVTGYKDEGKCDCQVGHNVYIDNDVRIMCNKLHIGNNCKIHNHVFIDGDEVWIGDNVWIGQYSHLDGKGGLIIEDDVTIGYNCYLWTHADRSGLPEVHKNWIKRPRWIVLRRGVWLMGANVQVNPGVTMGAFSVALGNSVVAHDTRPGRIYGGVPAKEVKEFRLR